MGQAMGSVPAFKQIGAALESEVSESFDSISNLRGHTQMNCLNAGTDPNELTPIHAEPAIRSRTASLILSGYGGMITWNPPGFQETIK